MDACLVLTTINVPTLLEGYAENFVEYGRYNIGFIVVGDIPTPHKKVKKLIQKIKDKGFEAEYLDMPSQKKWLHKFPKLSKLISYRSDNRRNIGFLMAAERNAEIIIAIDDDNYVSDDDYYKHHSIVGRTVTLPTVYSFTGWYNPCTLLRTNNSVPIYPRGYPFHKRFKESYNFKETTGHVVLNMGLWINDPDADAITNLACPTKIQGLKGPYERVMLAPSTYAPINTQNTAFHKSILPCYYYVLMGAYVKGLKIDRYGDIWSGFFAKKVIDKMNERVTIGKPLANHKRNAHDLLNDLKHELWGMILTEELVPWLEQLQLENNNYFDAYLEISKGLNKFKENFQEQSIGKYLRKISEAMEIWVDACTKIL